MRHDLDVKLKDISDKVTKGLNLEKKVWESLHEVESEVSKLMAEVDQVVEQVVSSSQVLARFYSETGTLSFIILPQLLSTYLCLNKARSFDGWDGLSEVFKNKV